MRALLVLSVLALAACDSDGTDLLQLNVSELSHDPALVVGTWELVSVTSAGFGTPPTTTSASALDWKESYTFRADGRVEVYRDGQLEESTVWTVETLPDGALSPSLRIGTETEYRREYFVVTPTRLYFDHRPADGPLLEYARR